MSGVITNQVNSSPGVPYLLYSDINAHLVNDVAIAANTQTQVGWTYITSNNDVIKYQSGEFIAQFDCILSITVVVVWGYNNTGIRNVILRSTADTGNIAASSIPAITTGSGNIQTINCNKTFKAGESLSVDVFQNSPGNLNIGGIATLPTAFTRLYISVIAVNTFY
jgi:hypothetical protein